MLSIVGRKFVMTFDLVQLSIVCAAKSKNSCVESTQEANKRVERGQRGRGGRTASHQSSSKLLCLSIHLSLASLVAYNIILC